MANKPAKKTAVKKTAPKKTVTKKTVATTTKKAPVKKAATKTVAPEKLACGCDKNCACAGKCHEHKSCNCCKRGFWKKLILFIIIFALGFASANLIKCDKRGKFGPRPEFDNGCLVIKCPKMAKIAPMMDADHNGCISKSEYKAAKKHMRAAQKKIKEIKQDVHVIEVAPVTAPAPAPAVAE